LGIIIVRISANCNYEIDSNMKNLLILKINLE